MPSWCFAPWCWWCDRSTFLFMFVFWPSEDNQTGHWGPWNGSCWLHWNQTNPLARWECNGLWCRHGGDQPQSRGINLKGNHSFLLTKDRWVIWEAKYFCQRKQKEGKILRLLGYLRSSCMKSTPEEGKFSSLKLLSVYTTQYPGFTGHTTSTASPAVSPTRIYSRLQHFFTQPLQEITSLTQGLNFASERLGPNQCQQVLPGKLSSFQRLIIFCRFCLFWAANLHTLVPQDWLWWEEDHSCVVCPLDWNRDFSRSPHQTDSSLNKCMDLKMLILCQTLAFEMRWQEHLPPHNVYSLNCGA